MSTPEEKIRIDNVKLRVRYLKEIPFYTSDEIRNFTPADANEAQDNATNWRKQNKVFAVQKDGVDVFPCFQFHDGKPIEVVEHLLSQMPNDMSDWEVAYWFSFENSYIENELAPNMSWHSF